MTSTLFPARARGGQGPTRPHTSVGMPLGEFNSPSRHSSSYKYEDAQQTPTNGMFGATADSPPEPPPGYFMISYLVYVILIVMAILLFIFVAVTVEQVKDTEINTDYCPSWDNCTVGIYTPEQGTCEFKPKPEFTPCNGTCLSPLVHEWTEFITEGEYDNPVCKHGECTDLIDAPSCDLGIEFDPSDSCPWFELSHWIDEEWADIFHFRMCSWGSCLYVIEWPSDLAPPIPCFGDQNGNYELKLRAGEICKSFVDSIEDPHADCWTAYATCVFGDPMCFIFRDGRSGAYPHLNFPDPASAAATEGFELAPPKDSHLRSTAVRKSLRATKGLRKLTPEHIQAAFAVDAELGSETGALSGRPHADRFEVTQEKIDNANTLLNDRSIIEIVADEYKAYKETRDAENSPPETSPPETSPEPTADAS